jgi:hypothetical protein
MGILVPAVTEKDFISRFLIPRPDPCRPTSSILCKDEALSSEKLAAKQCVTERVFTNFQVLKESQGETILNRERVVGNVSILRWASVTSVWPPRSAFS